METIKARAAFLSAAKGPKVVTSGFVLQAFDREDNGPFRVGFTCSKKVGNAVERNAAKRRLRALAQTVMPELARDGWDYVLIGRTGETESRDFAQMQGELKRALTTLNEQADPVPSEEPDGPGMG